jgi:hypothetical protein
MSIINYNSFERSLKKAMCANLEVQNILKNYDADDIKYLFMEDPDTLTTLKNYKTTIEIVLKKI